MIGDSRSNKFKTKYAPIKPAEPVTNTFITTQSIIHSLCIFYISSSDNPTVCILYRGNSGLMCFTFSLRSWRSILFRLRFTSATVTCRSRLHTAIRSTSISPLRSPTMKLQSHAPALHTFECERTAPIFFPDFPILALYRRISLYQHFK